jgi:hypothetical protein
MTAPFLKQSRIDPADIKKEWTGIDPLDYAKENKGKEPLLVNASWDHVIPKANALKLRDAFPGARQVWVPGGHYSAILHLLWMPGYVSRHFQKALAP